MSEAVVKRAAVVTGGSRGIGRAICVALAKQGCNVVVNYCHGVDAAAETVAQCNTLGVQAVAVQADVSTAEGCKKLFEEAVNAFGRVDILVNNAGVTRDNLILRLSEEDFDKVLNANLKGAFLCCKEAARRMVRQQGRPHRPDQEPGQGAGQPRRYRQCGSPRLYCNGYDGCPARSGSGGNDKGHPAGPCGPAG